MLEIAIFTISSFPCNISVTFRVEVFLDPLAKETVNLPVAIEVDVLTAESETLPLLVLLTAVKLAVIVLLALIVTVRGLAEPVASPDQLLNVYPVFAVAVRETDVPEV